MHSSTPTFRSQCSVTQLHSTKICPSGMCPASPTCTGCFLIHTPSSRRYVVRRGSTQMHWKLTCSTIRLALYWIQRLVSGCVGNLFIDYCCLYFLALAPTYLHLKTLAYLRYALSPPTDIHAPTHTLLDSMSAFSPQSGHELKRAVDHCQWAPTCYALH